MKIPSVSRTYCSFQIHIAILIFEQLYVSWIVDDQALLLYHQL